MRSQGRDTRMNLEERIDKIMDDKKKNIMKVVDNQLEIAKKELKWKMK